MIHRMIEVSGIAPTLPGDQPVPMLDWVPIARMVIDETFQRPLAAGNWTAIRLIAADFRWSRFTPVLLSPIADGFYSVIDGQHRVHAAAICGFLTVPAMIVPMTAAEMARAFFGVNAQVVRISVFHIYKAALAGGEAWAVSADAAVTAGGCRLMSFHASSSKKKSGEVYCIGTVRKLIEAGMGDSLTQVLSALRAYDTGNRIPLYSDLILAPLTRAVASDQAFGWLDLLVFLRAQDPFKVIDQVYQRFGVQQKYVLQKDLVHAIAAKLYQFATLETAA